MRTLLFILMMLLAVPSYGAGLKPSTSYTDFSEDANCKGCYRFNEDITYPVDISGEDNHLTLGSGTAFTSSGKEGSGYTFDGIDDNMSPKDNTVFEYNNTESFSFSVWVKTAGDTDRQTIVDKRDTGDASGYNMWVETDGITQFFVSDGATIKDATSPTTTVDDNTWHHMVGIVDRDNDDIILYIDGELEENSDTAGHGNIDNDGVFYIGDGNVNAAGSSLKEWKGSMDEFIIFDDVLTPAEVLELYEKGIQ